MYMVALGESMFEVEQSRIMWNYLFLQHVSFLNKHVFEDTYQFVDFITLNLVLTLLYI